MKIFENKFELTYNVIVDFGCICDEDAVIKHLLVLRCYWNIFVKHDSKIVLETTRGFEEHLQWKWNGKLNC